MCYKKKNIKNPIRPDHLTGFDKVHLNVPCGTCPACRKVRSNDWLVRSYFEFLDNHRQAFFCSLDFDNVHRPSFNGKPCFDSEIMKKFLKRLRKQIGSFRYFYSTDFGGFLKNPHYHIIVLPEKRFTESSFFFHIRKTWQQGSYQNVESIDCVNHNRLKAIQYVVSYSTKDVTFNVDEYYKECDEFNKIPMRFRPRCQASKGFGLRALELGTINPDTLLSNSTIALPVGKNGKLVQFAVPRYYEMKYCYDYSWNKKELKAELTKNALGIEVAKSRHNNNYIYFIKDLFSSRWLDVSKYVDYQFNHSWYNVVTDVLSDLDDFKEFAYVRPFIRSNLNGFITDTLSDTPYFRPNWLYFEQVSQTYESYKKHFNDIQCQIEFEKMIKNAKFRAMKRLERKPSLYRYLEHKNFDFSQLNV